MYVDLKTRHYPNKEKLMKEFPMIKPVPLLVPDKWGPYLSP